MLRSLEQVKSLVMKYRNRSKRGDKSV